MCDTKLTKRQCKYEEPTYISSNDFNRIIRSMNEGFLNRYTAPARLFDNCHRNHLERTAMQNGYAVSYTYDDEDEASLTIRKNRTIYPDSGWAIAFSAFAAGILVGMFTVGRK